MADIGRFAPPVLWKLLVAIDLGTEYPLSLDSLRMFACCLGIVGTAASDDHTADAVSP